MLITSLLGGFRFGGFALSAVDAIKYLLLWALAFTVAGLFEEVLYRGYALHALSAGIGFWPAAVILSALFGGLHLFNPGETAIGAIDVFTYGVFACLTLRRTGNLWFAIGIHSAWDFSLTVLYSVPGSGMQATGHLLHSSLQGPTWLTGGPDGPEGSVIGLTVLLAAFLLFPRFFPRSEALAS
jgi:membrane protease YdiL (CAAX protease family)